MGAKKEALILKALEERKRHAGRHLLPDAHDTAAALVGCLREHAPDATIDAGRQPAARLRDLRRSSTSSRPARRPSLMDAFVEYRLVERVLARGDTKSSVLLRGGFQADLRLVAADSRGAALQYFTGSKAHNIALRDRAIGLGFKLNEYGLFRVEGDEQVAGETEEGVYEALGLPMGAAGASRGPRRDRGGAAARRCPVWSTAPICAATCTCTRPRPTARTTSRRWPRPRAPAASSTSPSPITASRWRWPTAWTSGARSRTRPASARSTDAHGVRLLAGIECDIRPDGTLDLADDCLAALDLVVASVHSAFNQDRQQMTDRLLRAIENPHVDILGHPTGRLILRREPYPVDIEAVLDAAARHGVALEINCQVDRLDLNDVHARLARERGVPLVISSDAHSDRGARLDLRWGVAGRPARLARAAARAQHAAVRGVQGARLTPPPEAARPMTPLRMLTADDKLAEIRRLYFKTTQADDSGGPREGARPAEIDDQRGRARAGDGLHGRPRRDVQGLGTEGQAEEAQRAEQAGLGRR